MGFLTVFLSVLISSAGAVDFSALDFEMDGPDPCEARRAEVVEIPYGEKLVNGRIPRDGGLEDGQVMLTFDDGPVTRNFPHILDALAECGARAHFFFVGNRMARLHSENPDLLFRARSEGHQVGSHSMTHAHGLRLGDMIERGGPRNWARIHTEIPAAHRLVMAAAAAETPFFRFPYGNGWRSPAANRYLDSLGLINFFWNMDTGDSDPGHPRGAEGVYQRTVQTIARQRRGILLAHERDSTTAALPRILRFLVRNRFSIVVFTP